MGSTETTPGAPLSHRPTPLGNGTAGQGSDGAVSQSLKSLARQVLSRSGRRTNSVPRPVPHAAPGGTSWDAADWRAYFDEWAGIAEHDQGAALPVAEALAYAATVGEWCCRHPIPEGDHSECHHCRELRQGAAIVPVLNGMGGHFWIHNGCLPAHLEARRQQAIAALRAIGLEPPASYQSERQAR
jgi:hypothetical protein